jgi:hypothetical protein
MRRDDGAAPLFEVGEPADPPEKRRRPPRRPGVGPGVWCLDGPHWLTDEVSIQYRLGPECRKARGIEVPKSPRRRTWDVRVRGWKPGDEQPGMFDEEELNEEGDEA